MDISFSLQALSVLYLSENELDIGVYNVPEEIDTRVAKLKLEAMGISIDKLTEKQKKYLSSWEEGT